MAAADWMGGSPRLLLGYPGGHMGPIFRMDQGSHSAEEKAVGVVVGSRRGGILPEVSLFFYN